MTDKKQDRTPLEVTLPGGEKMVLGKAHPDYDEDGRFKESAIPGGCPTLNPYDTETNLTWLQMRNFYKHEQCPSCKRKRCFTEIDAKYLNRFSQQCIYCGRQVHIDGLGSTDYDENYKDTP